MPVKGTKDFDQSKHETVVTTFVSGTPIAPAAGHVSVYTDLASTFVPGVTVESRLNELIDRARESAFGGPTAADIYFHTPVVLGGKHNILVTTDPLDIVSGHVGIGISSAVRSAGPSTLMIMTSLKEIIQWMGETGHLVVGP